MPFTHLDIGGPVATLSLDHACGNRINFDMRLELREAIQRIETSPARAPLIRGEGGDFCLGGDVRDWPGIPTEILRPQIQVFAEALDHLERLPIPTIAAVQGGCMGGGFELALSCDLILAARWRMRGQPCAMPPRRSMRASRSPRQVLPASEPGGVTTKDRLRDSQ
jgi:enoyl-CoA hydratase/carnithine racemase